MKLVHTLLTLVTTVTTVTVAVAGWKCRTSVDVVIRWTVDCSAMNLSSAPPPMIIHPVVTLNMSHNSFQHLKESQFTNWSDISVLDLSSNYIRTIDENSFKGLSNLTEIYLNNNALRVLSTNITNHLLKLKVLSISNNELKAIEPTVFDTIPSLFKLYLGHNIELGSVQQNLYPLKTTLNKSLLSLGLENISLTEMPTNLFSEATHLIYLNLALNSLKNISRLPVSLRYLNISGTLIETISNDSFSDLHLIQKLSLESMPDLKEITAGSFNSFDVIEELFIRNCSKLSVISDTAFSKSHPKLKKVVFSYCAFASLPRTFKPVFSQVKYLDLQGNPWSCDSSISWLLNMNLENLTCELRCAHPPSAKGMLLTDYFRPRTLHPHTSLIRAAVLVMLVAVLVVSVVAMVKQAAKQKAKTYRQLNNIKLEDRTLPPL